MFILIFLTTVLSAFACQTDAIRVVRSTGVGANSNGNSSGYAHQRVSIPVRFEGQSGCWEKIGGLSFEVKDKSRTMTVLTPKSSFNNLPGRVMNYALLKKTGGQLELDIASFVCLGNFVLAAETYRGSVEEARALQQLDMQVSTVFATGAAAANLARHREELARRFGRTSDLPQNLQEYFEERFQGSWSALEHYEVWVPSIYLSSNFRSPLASLESSYHTRVLTKSACSPEFEAVMAPLRYENLKLPSGVRSKLKKGNLQISW